MPSPYKDTESSLLGPWNFLEAKRDGRNTEELSGYFSSIKFMSFS